MRHVVCLLVCLLASAAASDAATRTVCAAGCQYTSLQIAINEAVPGDVILLRAGETYVGNYLLKAKSGSSTAFITITSDAPASTLPGAGVRLIPEGKPGANTARAALPRLLGKGGESRSLEIFRTEPGAHHYRLQFLEIDGTAQVGYETLISIGANDSTQTTASAAPYAIVLDHLWIHGHATKGVKRGVAANGRSVDIFNSYIEDAFALGDAQAIAVFNAPGPIRIVNNFLEAAAENILIGGDDPKILNLVPSDIEIRANHFRKDLAWRNPALATPAKPSVSARTGGSLAAGTHYFKVVAVMGAGGETIVSTPSAEASVTVAAGGAVALSWPSIAGADKYRVYRGTSTNGQIWYLESTSTSMTYTGASETSNAPRSTGHKWTAKNLLELKNAQRVTIDGNLFEYNWAGFQSGYAILFTPKNQGGKAPWSIVRDVVFSHNVLRHSAAGINIAGTDYEAPSQQAQNIRIVHNLFEDLSAAYGNKGQFLVLTSGPRDVVVDHNTIVNEGTIVDVDGATVAGFVFTNNFSKHNLYGIKGAKRAVGIDTLDYFMPGWTFRGNVLAGGSANIYPAGNFFPTVAEFYAAFVNAAAGDYRLLSTSIFARAGTDGTAIGAALPGTSSGADPEPEPEPEPEPQPQPGTLPDGWQSEDVGAVGAVGGAAVSGTAWTVAGAGADVWGTADAFHFAYRALSGDGSIVARVAAVNGSEPWTKVGVMIRATTSASAAHAFMLVSKGRGLAFQRRTGSGGVSEHTAGPAGTAPRWVKLTRAGSVISAHTSTDGSTWTLVGSDTFAMPTGVLIGLAATSHTTGAVATATFDNVAVSAGGALPAGWDAADIGSTGKAGSTSFSGGTFTVKGAGADIWGTADALHFASRTLDGDGEIVARVASIAGAQPWTKVGVMMRQSLDAGSAQALMLVSTGRGLAFQRRTVTGGTSVHTAGGAGTAPRWVKLTRAGQTITASVSANGSTWTVVGRDTFSIVGPIHVGLAVSSHDVGALATGVFDNVAID